MEKDTRRSILDAALSLLGEHGASRLTLRTVEDAAGVPHGSVRYHFGDRAGLIGALVAHLAETEVQGPEAPTDLAVALGRLLGPGRTLTLARYELFLLAARDPTLRPPLIKARERFVARLALLLGAERAPGALAALDGLVLDALVRGEHDPESLKRAVEDLLGARR